MPIKQKNIVTEMETSYLDYAMSVIVARALPDVRDGLKPVHRRILVTMNDLHLTHSAKHRKSAKICGDVSGNYHPHGEVIVYPSMVRMAQEFAMRYQLVDGQGNFGSIDGDNAAAMRYTEARMKKISEEMLRDLEKKTVDFQDNYDGTRKEPTVLPARVPQLLLNGTLGIAVGMATNIPPHNLGEICDGVIALIDKSEIKNSKSEALNSKQILNSNDSNTKPGLEHSNLENSDLFRDSNLEIRNYNIESSISIDELMQYIKGPDLPTGGVIYAGQGLVDAYNTGRGKIIIRGEAEIVETTHGASQIIITSVPYQVNKAELVTKIADLVTNKKIIGISDLRDESDRKGIRVAIDLKKGSFPKKILNTIYSQTSLQTAFHFNMLALVDGIEPRVLNLKEILFEFVKFRFEIITRRSQFELAQAKDRLHILEGFLKALDIIDEVVATIRKSKTREEAHGSLMSKFAFSDGQATAILDMRLASLVGLERERLENEHREKKEFIAYLEDLLANPNKILGVIKDETLEIKTNYADKRKTEIKIQELGSFKAEDLVPDEEVLLTITKSGYIKRVATNAYKSQGRGGKGVIGMSTKEEDEVEELIVTQTHDTILFFTDLGKIFKSKIYEIPAVSRQSKGVALQNIVSISSDENVTAILTVNKDVIEKAEKSEDDHPYIMMGTENGVVKKTSLKSFKNVRTTGIAAISLNSGDKLKWAKLTSSDDVIIEVSKSGQCIVYSEKDVRPMGRSASGVRGMRLRQNDKVITLTMVPKETFSQYELIVVLENGFGKRSKLSLFDIQKRGGIGIKAANVTGKTGSVVDARIVHETEKGTALLVSKLGIVIRMTLSDIKLLGRVTQGVTLMRLGKGDKVASVAVVPKTEEPEESQISN